MVFFLFKVKFKYIIIYIVVIKTGVDKMIDNKKEQEREELHRTIWGIADDLRGSVDGWDFKTYILGTMFYRYISEFLRNFINKGEHEAENFDFDYVKISDEDALQIRVEEKNFNRFYFIKN